MSGSPSVPLAIGAFYLENTLTKIVLWVTAAGCILSAYSLWRPERTKVIELQKQLIPKVHLEFDPASVGCIRKSSPTELCIRVLPVCDTPAPIANCVGKLNGVYRRTSENDAWERTQLDEVISLKWAGHTYDPITLTQGVYLYLDLLTINDHSGIILYAPPLPWRAADIFAPDDFYRFNIVVTGDNHAEGLISLQLRRGRDWDRPMIRAIGL